MRLFWTVLACLVVSLGAFGCGPACDRGHLCSIAGHQPDVQVCDGEEFRSCSDGNRGKEIDCGKSSRRAVCTLDGWTFQNTGTENGP